MEQGAPKTDPGDRSPAASRHDFAWKARMHSFRYAFAGLHFAVRREHNMRIHLGAAAAVVLLGWGLGISASDWRWLIFAIALVLITEMFNTAIEQACDAVSTGHHPAIGAAKDAAAAAVLLSSLASALIGASVFFPYLAKAMH